MSYASMTLVSVSSNSLHLFSLGREGCLSLRWLIFQSVSPCSCFRTLRNFHSVGLVQPMRDLNPLCQPSAKLVERGRPATGDGVYRGTANIAKFSVCREISRLLAFAAMKCEIYNFPRYIAIFSVWFL